MLQGPHTQFNDKNKIPNSKAKIIGLNIKKMLKIFHFNLNTAFPNYWLNNNAKV